MIHIIVVGLVILIVIVKLCSISASSRRTARRSRRLPCPTCGEALLPAARNCPSCRNPVRRGWEAGRHRMWHGRPP
jgi:hypothetical protein